METRNAENGRFSGTVQGSQRQAYKTTATVMARRSARASAVAVDRTRVSGVCTCPVGRDCKHVAALLLEVLASQGLPAKPGTSGTAQPRERLLYRVTVAPDWNGVARFRVMPLIVTLRRDGAMVPGSARAWDPAAPATGPIAKLLKPEDMAILAALNRFGQRQGGTSLDGRGLDGVEGVDILTRMIATGRCHWRDADGPVLALGAPRSGRVRWVIGRDGKQRSEVEVEGEAPVGVMAPPWYIDPVAAVCGPVDIGMAPRAAAAFLTAPPLSRTEIARSRARLASSVLARRLAAPDLPPPPEPLPQREITATPVPRILLHCEALKPAPFWPVNRRHAPVAGATVPLLRLSFVYDGIEIAADEKSPRPIVTAKDGRPAQILRQQKAERAAAKQLEDLGFAPLSSQHRWTIPGGLRGELTLSRGEADDDDHWLDFLVADLPRLTGLGWQVKISEKFPIRLVEADGDIDAALLEGSSIDWFELNLGIMIAGERVDILPAMLKLLQGLPLDGLFEYLDDDSRDADIIRLRLDDGRVLPLPQGRVRPILRALAGLFDSGHGDDGKRVILRRADAVEVATLEAASGLVWRGGEALRALGRRLKEGRGLPDIVVPATFNGALRPYQHDGLAWLQLLRETGLGGLLADDMGLGKTVQVLAHLAIEKESGRLDRPCLVVAPTSLMPNWRAEAHSFTPQLSVLVQHGIDRKAEFQSLKSYDIVLTTYALLARDIELLMAQPWHMVIIDEAQFVKNPATAAAKALRRLNARHRLALTGTPLENHLGELWSLFDFVSPGFLGDHKGFVKTWRSPIEKKGDMERQKRLAGRVKPFLLRRTKAAVAADLPPKTEIIEQIELGSGQRALYDGIRLAMHRKVRDAIAAKGLNRSRIEFLDALLKLRQVCCDPRLVKTSGIKPIKAGSAKLERLMEMLPELIDEGRRILVFSQFTSMLELIEEELNAAKIPFVLLTGQTRDRATPVAEFQRGHIPVFLISLKAGGTGLNLTAADTVIHYDPWWNPAVEAQATDRAHRIGQDKPVFVHKLVALDTIEVKMAELKSRKQALADGLFDPEQGGALEISEDDIDFLLGDPV